MCETIDTKSGRIEYAISGQGIPVVFFHGGHSNCRETLFQKGWDLSKYRIIIPSRPGYGNTPLNQNVTPQQTAELINELLKILGIDRIIIVGISAGGLSAIEYTVLFPQKVCNLILISAVTKRWLNESDNLYKRGVKIFSPAREKLSWKFFRIFFRLLPGKMTKTLFRELSSVDPFIITKEEIQEIRQMVFKQASGSGFITDLNQTIDADTIRKVNCPTLILHSKNDKSVPMEMALYAHREIKTADLKVFDNKWGHLLWVGEDSAHPIDEMNLFLRENNCLS